jgi:peptidoglycan/xylan/chitin deacetylase (PgdA/CDA1 family)
MPWKDNYTISNERSLTDAELRWPAGKSCCVSITVDLSLAATGDGLKAAELSTPVARFALTEGLDNLLGLLRKHKLKATFATPAAMVKIHGSRLKEILAEGHEIAAEAMLHEDVSGLPREVEKARLERTTAILSEAIGKAPAGWFMLSRQGDAFAGGTISPNTIDLLIEGGYRYYGNGLADDAPYWTVADFATRRALPTMPYYYHFDDQYFCMFPMKGTGLENPDMFIRNLRWEFEAQHKRGRHFHMTWHPQHMGYMHRLKMLDDFLTWMTGHAGLWNPTAEQCIAHWSGSYPVATHLKLEPSIWQDHPGSLS